MADSKEVIEDIDLLLENSQIHASDIFEESTGSQYAPTAPFDHIYLGVETIKQSQSQVVDISKLYYQQNKVVQKQIREHLLLNIEGTSEVAATVTGVFFQIGAIDELIDFIIKEYTDPEKIAIVASLLRLNHLLFYCWESFSKSQIKKIRNWCKETVGEDNALGCSVYFFRVASIVQGIDKQTNLILVHDVRQRIELGFNPEINEDEEKIKEEFSRFGFPEHLSETLNKIDQQLSASKDAFDFKSTMDLLRSFTEILYRAILDQYGDEGKKISEKDSGDVAKFFVGKSLVNKDFGDMIVNQRHFLSNLASHRIKAREEDARLSKNMVIEMSLYIMRRLQNN